MTLATILPYLLAAALGWLVKHFGLIESLLGKAAGRNPLAPAGKPAPALPLPTIKLGNHPIVSDAVNAAINQAVSDIFAGHMSSIKSELEAAAKAAVEKAIADMKAKA